MTPLDAGDKKKFLFAHFGHRLSLLLTLRERRKSGYDYGGQGDIYRCVKDSNLLGVRLWLDFLGLRGSKTDAGVYELVENGGKRWPDDVGVEHFIGHTLKVEKVPLAVRRVLAGVYVRADKELAHLTTTFNDEFNEEAALIEAATAVESLLTEFLYLPLGEKMPAITC
jgi:hypothetical protein